MLSKIFENCRAIERTVPRISRFPDHCCRGPFSLLKTQSALGYGVARERLSGIRRGNGISAAIPRSTAISWRACTLQDRSPIKPHRLVTFRSGSGLENLRPLARNEAMHLTGPGGLMPRGENRRGRCRKRPGAEETGYQV